MVGSSSGYLQHWRAATGQVPRVHLVRSAVTAIAGGDRVLVGSADGVVRLYDLPTRGDGEIRESGAWTDADLALGAPSVGDEDGRYATNFDFVGLPDTYVVDRTGTIRYQVIGQVHNAATLTTLLNRLLSGAPSAGSAS